MRSLRHGVVVALSVGLIACPPKAPLEKVALDSDAAWFGEEDEEPDMPIISTTGVAPVICGEIRLSPDIAAAQPTAAWSGAWLMVFARRASAGPVVAGFSGRLPKNFPVKFCLSRKHLIAPGDFSGALFLSARIDSDGKPELDPGDFDGSAKAAFPVGTRNALVVIDTFR